VKAGLVVAVAGGLVLALGVIFGLQGLSVVGPESSFMYSSPDWISYGAQIAVVGAAVLGAGVIVVARTGR